MTTNFLEYGQSICVCVCVCVFTREGECHLNEDLVSLLVALGLGTAHRLLLGRAGRPNAEDGLLHDAYLVGLAHEPLAVCGNALRDLAAGSLDAHHIHHLALRVGLALDALALVDGLAGDRRAAGFLVALLARHLLLDALGAGRAPDVLASDGAVCNA